MRGVDVSQKRFGVDGSYVAEQFMSTKNPSGGFVDFESAKPEKIAAGTKGLFKGVDAPSGGFSSPMAGRWLRILQSSEPDSPQSVDALSALIRSRAMCRSFLPDPVAPSIIREIVDLGARAPSAGRSQGLHVVQLTGDEREQMWSRSLPGDRREGFAFPGLLEAPVLLLLFVDPDAYVERTQSPIRLIPALGMAEGSGGHHSGSSMQEWRRVYASRCGGLRVGSVVLRSAST